jgi:hypothetical protein
MDRTEELIQHLLASLNPIIEEIKLKQEVSEGEIEILNAQRANTTDATKFSWDDLKQFGDSQKATGEAEGAMWVVTALTKAISEFKPK